MQCGMYLMINLSLEYFVRVSPRKTEVLGCHILIGESLRVREGSQSLTDLR